MIEINFYEDNLFVRQTLICSSWAPLSFCFLNTKYKHLASHVYAAWIWTQAQKMDFVWMCYDLAAAPVNAVMMDFSTPAVAKEHSSFSLTTPQHTFHSSMKNKRWNNMNHFHWQGTSLMGINFIRKSERGSLTTFMRIPENLKSPSWNIIASWTPLLHLIKAN